MESDNNSPTTVAILLLLLFAIAGLIGAILVVAFLMSGMTS